MEAVRPRRRYRLNRSRIPVLFVTIMLVYFAVSLGLQLNKLFTLERNLTVMEAQVKELKDKNNHLWDKLEVLNSESYIEETARERLGLVKRGETRVVPVPQNYEGRPIDNTIRD